MSARHRDLRRPARLAMLLASMLGFTGRAALADVVVGDVITAANVDQAKELISPGIEWCVRHGWPLKIVETKKIEWPKAYKDATEKYSPQVKLAPDGLTLQSYVAGQPFPKVDANDPQVATKIMWNYEYRRRRSA